MWNDDDKDFMKYNDEEKVCGLLPAVVIPAVAAAASKLPELELQLLRRTQSLPDWLQKQLFMMELNWSIQ